MLYGVFLWRQLNKIVFINIWRIVISIFLLRWIVKTVINNLLAGRVHSVPFRFYPLVLLAHRLVVRVNRLELAAPVVKPGSLAHERLLDTSSGQLDVDLLLLTTPGSDGMLLLVGQKVFQIISLLGEGAAGSIMRKHAIVLRGGNALGRLLA